MNKGIIILLNGASSSGKSSLSKELVNQLDGYFHLSIDDYDKFIEKAEDRNSGHLIPVPTEYFFHRTIAMFSDLGVNVVADQILHDRSTTEDCIKVLKGYPVFFVGVHCPLSILEQREQQRGDRTIGQAKKQLEYIHQQKEVYDIEVDTHTDSTEECAKKIRKALAAPNSSGAWLTTVRNAEEQANV